MNEAYLLDELTKSVLYSNFGLGRRLDEESAHALGKCTPFFGGHLSRKFLVYFVSYNYLNDRVRRWLQKV